VIRSPRQGDLKVLPAILSEQRQSRTIANEVEVSLPTIHWTPDLVETVAHLLADALVRDLHEHPPGHARITT
jgi:hypothetical protein